MLTRQRGSSLLEVIVAASLGLLVILAVQQTWAWQMGQQLGHSDSTKAFLTAQSLVEQLAQDIADANPAAINLSGNCYLLPQHDGRQLAYRVKNKQVQRHTLAPYCPTTGWQSLSHYHSVAIKSLTLQLFKSQGLPTLSIALMAKSPRDDSFHAFNREVVLDAVR
jgi:type II secretory pathway pseudopilin PulG